jgi:hypothetical protein
MEKKIDLKNIMQQQASAEVDLYEMEKRFKE